MMAKLAAIYCKGINRLKIKWQKCNDNVGAILIKYTNKQHNTHTFIAPHYANAVLYIIYNILLLELSYIKQQYRTLIPIINCGLCFDNSCDHDSTAATVCHRSGNV